MKLIINGEVLVSKQISNSIEELEQIDIVLSEGVNVVCLWGDSNNIKFDNVSLGLTQIHEKVTF